MSTIDEVFPMTLVLSPTVTSIDAIELDASVSETHGSEVEVTEHPVEEGANITDHARVKPLTLTIEGLISNTPVGIGQTTRALASGGFVFRVADTFGASPKGAAGYAEQAFAKLEQLRDNPRLITIVTSLKSYEKMLLTALSAPRNATIGESLRFTATFKSVRLVKNQTVQVTVTKTTQGQGKKGLGKQAAKKADGEGDRETTALLDLAKKAKAAVSMIGKIM